MDKTIEQRAEEYAPNTITSHIFKSSPLKGLIVRILRDTYIAGATDQQAIDEEVRLKKSDDMTKAEYDRETAFADWYLKNGKGTPTYSDAIEWARKQTIDEVCEYAKARYDLDYCGNVRDVLNYLKSLVEE